MSEELIQAIYSLTKAINNFQTFLEDFAEAYTAEDNKTEVGIEEFHFEDSRPQSQALRRKIEE